MIVVRPMRKEDRPLVLRMIALGSEAHRQMMGHGYKKLPQELIDAHVIFIAEDCGVVVGMTGGRVVGGGVGEATLAYVAPGSRKRGIAVRLLQVVCSYYTARGKKMQGIVYEKNVASQRLVKKLGFKMIGKPSRSSPWQIWRR